MSALTSVAATPIDWSVKFFLILFILLWPIVSFRFSMVREFIKKYHHNLAEEKNCYAKAEYIHKVTNMFTQNCNFESLCVNLLSFVLFHSTVILFSALDNSSVQGANWKKKANTWRPLGTLFSLFSYFLDLKMREVNDLFSNTLRCSNSCKILNFKTKTRPVTPCWHILSNFCKNSTYLQYFKIFRHSNGNTNKCMYLDYLAHYGNNEIIKVTLHA